MAKKDIDNIVKGALLGACFGYAFTGRKDAGVLAAMAGAIIGVSLEGKDKAKKANIPLLTLENGWLIEVGVNGTKTKIKKISGRKKPNLPQTFEL